MKDSDRAMWQLDGRLSETLAQAQQKLLGTRAAAGYWAGHLSSSPLSTATAVCALALVAKESSTAQFEESISGGISWLAAHANPDGGWGDTILSLSNISTTLLVWSAFAVAPGAAGKYPSTVTEAEAWLSRTAGGLERSRIADAVLERYGKDRTFSVPILTTCALAGRLGPEPEAWESVISLPFELAACPHQWFATLRLPVVSYALPALIAIGQVKHHHRPSLNPILRWLRHLTRARSLRVLREIQPASGGFLEATPLTSFVVMSLASSGQAKHPVTTQGVRFLLQSARADGSWPIDSNLATWLTILSLEALGQGNPALSHDEKVQLRNWLLDQQYAREHLYTHAPPGGWAWTDLPGGVPDADDTAGALVALRTLVIDERTRQAAEAGIHWLLNLQNRDGGIPTFCRGWGALPFDRSSPDLTAHALRAWNAWETDLPPPLKPAVERATRKALGYLIRRQRNDGAWIPLWFGNQFVPGEENPTCGTARVLAGLSEVEMTIPGVDRAIAAAVRWLVFAQNKDGSWGGSAGIIGSVEETALALDAVAVVLENQRLGRALAGSGVESALLKGAQWLVNQVLDGGWTKPAPIGFYFAKLWYYEELYPLIFTVGALNKVARVRQLDAVAKVRHLA